MMVKVAMGAMKVPVSLILKVPFLLLLSILRFYAATRLKIARIFWINAKLQIISTLNLTYAGGA